MSTTSAREFNRDVGAAKRQAVDGPVVITDRGEPAFVLLSIDEYRRMGEHGIDLVDRLNMNDDLDIDFADPLVIPRQGRTLQSVSSTHREGEQMLTRKGRSLLPVAVSDRIKNVDVRVLVDVATELSVDAQEFDHGVPANRRSIRR